MISCCTPSPPSWVPSAASPLASLPPGCCFANLAHVVLCVASGLDEGDIYKSLPWMARVVASHCSQGRVWSPGLHFRALLALPLLTSRAFALHPPGSLYAVAKRLPFPARAEGLPCFQEQLSLIPNDHLESGHVHSATAHTRKPLPTTPHSCSAMSSMVIVFTWP
ncbi:unnamed protein product [Rangifer tarandus platyrhynchus]|uniref:Secreted protein n=2 Tax=Rangifer tarandus platyrhynchus TaxID=3082113 RepID=A0ABN8YNZ9_RANTA|nr:unnamed protein product [Rangifer tarandus platyrhynchus]